MDVEDDEDDLRLAKEALTQTLQLARATTSPKGPAHVVGTPIVFAAASSREKRKPADQTDTASRIAITIIDQTVEENAEALEPEGRGTEGEVGTEACGDAAPVFKEKPSSSSRGQYRKRTGDL